MGCLWTVVNVLVGFLTRFGSILPASEELVELALEHNQPPTFPRRVSVPWTHHLGHRRSMSFHTCCKSTLGGK